MVFVTGNANDISTNADSISDNADHISTLNTEAKINADDILSNALSITSNTDDVEDNADAIADNTDALPNLNDMPDITAIKVKYRICSCVAFQKWLCYKKLVNEKRTYVKTLLTGSMISLVPVFLSLPFNDLCSLK